MPVRQTLSSTPLTQLEVSFDPQLAQTTLVPQDENTPDYVSLPPNEYMPFTSSSYVDELAAIPDMMLVSRIGRLPD